MYTITLVFACLVVLFISAIIGVEIYQHRKARKIQQPIEPETPESENYDANRKKALIIKIVWIILLVILLSFISAKIGFSKIPWILWFIGLSIIYLALCYITVSGEERAVKIILGVPYKTIDSGPHLKLFPIEKVYLFPREEQRIDIDALEIITAEKNNGGKKYSAAAIKVDATFYFFWPDGDNLIKAYINGPSPDKPEEVKTFFEHAIMDAIAEEGGGRTWLECYQKRTDYAHAAEVSLIENSKGKEKGPVGQTGIEDCRLVIPHITLPPDLSSSITLRQIAALNADAQEEEGRGEKLKRALIGKGDAEARKAIFKAIQEVPEGLGYEYLLTLRKVAEGQSTTLLYGLPPFFINKLEQTLGGTKVEDILKQLGPEGIKKLIEQLQSSMAK